jgi:glycogen phosphorylase
VNVDHPATAEDPPSLLWTLEELGELVSRSGNPSETLTNIVHLIQRRFATDVCSVYLLEPDRANLVLAATIGLRPDSVGRVRMRLTEGLVGLVAEQVRPVVVHDTTTHPRFKYFQDAGEDPYRTFLGVPVMDRSVLQGVLVVQTAEARTFGDGDVRLLTTAGAQLAPIVSEARAVGQFVAPVHQRLGAIARNLRWSWDDDSASLFRDLDPVLWRTCNHNPIDLLQRIPIDQLELRVMSSFAFDCADCRQAILVQHQATADTGSMSWSIFPCPHCGQRQRHLFAVPVVTAEKRTSARRPV